MENEYYIEIEDRIDNLMQVFLKNNYVKFFFTNWYECSHAFFEILYFACWTMGSIDHVHVLQYMAKRSEIALVVFN